MGYITISAKNRETYSSISNFFIDYYMTDANGDFVKIYLYLVRLMSSSGPVAVSDIADHFNFTEKDICRAIKYWISKGVMELIYAPSGEPTGINLLPLSEPDTGLSSEFDGDVDFLVSIPKPDKTAAVSVNDLTVSASTGTTSGHDQTAPSNNMAGSRNPVQVSSNPLDGNGTTASRKLPAKAAFSPELAAKAEEDSAFSDILFFTETYLGKTLSSRDIESLIYIHDQLGFSAEIIQFLEEHLVSSGIKSIQYFEDVAVTWYNENVKTLDDAKRAATKHNPLYKAVFNELGIRNRYPGSAEIAFMDSWQSELHFDVTIIKEACKRGVLNNPTSVNFAYIDGILRNWYKNGVQGLKDIEELDRKHKARTVNNGTNSYKVKANSFNTFSKRDSSKDDIDELEELFLKEVNS